jgi:hypothetical protein
VIAIITWKDFVARVWTDRGFPAEDVFAREGIGAGEREALIGT